MLGRTMIAGLVAVSVTTPGCGGDGGGEIVVLAASSLTDAFGEIEVAFERANPDVDVVVSYGGSSSLVAQLGAGAPADVLATADAATMVRAVEEGSVDDPVEFAHNSMVIAVEAGNPLGITTLADLGGEDLTVVVAAPEVPAGAYAVEIFDRVGVSPDIASYEQNVRAVAAKVGLGEADAGLVYSTDTIGNPDIDAVTIPEGENVVALYTVAVTTGASAGDVGSFIAFLLGDEGRSILRDHGFGAP